MSIVASVKVYDGIVLGAESMTQIYANVPERGQQLVNPDFRFGCSTVSLEPVAAP